MLYAEFLFPFYRIDEKKKSNFKMFVLIYIVVTFNHAGDHDLSILYTLQAINITLIIFMNYIP